MSTPRVVLLGPHREPTRNETYAWRRRAEKLLPGIDVIDPIRLYPQGIGPAEETDLVKQAIRESSLALRYFPHPTSSEDMQTMFAVMHQVPVVAFGAYVAFVETVPPWVQTHLLNGFSALEPACEFIRSYLEGIAL